MARDRRRAKDPVPSRSGLLGTLRHDANAIMQSVANEVAPVVVNAIDLDGVVQQIDIQEIIDKVDIQAIVERVDIEIGPPTASACNDCCETQTETDMAPTHG